MSNNADPQTEVARAANLTGANDGFVYHDLGGTHSEVWTFILFRIPTACFGQFTSDNIPIYWFDGDSDTVLDEIDLIQVSGSWYLGSGWASGATGTFGPVIAADTWYALEGRHKLFASGGQFNYEFEFKLSGGSILATQNSNTNWSHLFPSSHWQTWKIGQTTRGTAGANNFYYLDNPNLTTAGFVGQTGTGNLLSTGFESGSAVPPFDATPPSDFTIVGSPGGTAAYTAVSTAPQGVCIAFGNNAFDSSPTWTRIDA